MFEKLTIPNTLAAGPGPGNTDPRVLEQFSKAKYSRDFKLQTEGKVLK